MLKKHVLKKTRRFPLREGVIGETVGFPMFNFIKQYIQYCIMSNGNIRIVKYNEDLFKVPSKTQKRKKPDKPIKLKTERKVSSKTIKNNILKEIRKNQENHYKSLLSESVVSPNSLSADFENDFQKSVDFMKKIAEKQKETTANQTIKNHNAMVGQEQGVQPVHDTGLIQVQLEEPEEMMYTTSPMLEVQPEDSYYAPVEPIKILPRPTYGCLKNGSLPTFRSYHNRTMKAPEPLSVPPLMIAERVKSPAELILIEKLKQREIEKKSKNQIVKQKKYKKLLRRTYRCGKDRYKPNVGVLLPNKTIRTNVTTKSYLIKQTPISEIRNTLVKQGFIKVGSSAPNDVLRKIYESIQMIDGDVKNHNPDNLLYNFFNEKYKS
jgi:hypothetical protein